MGYFRAHKGTLMQEGMYDSFSSSVFLFFSNHLPSCFFLPFSVLGCFPRRTDGAPGSAVDQTGAQIQVACMVKHAVFLCFFAVFVLLNAAVSFVFLCPTDGD